MRDPLGAFESIKENFLLYVKTAFGTRFKAINEERGILLEEGETFSKLPWIEPLPVPASTLWLHLNQVRVVVASFDLQPKHSWDK